MVLDTRIDRRRCVCSPAIGGIDERGPYGRSRNIRPYSRTVRSGYSTLGGHERRRVANPAYPQLFVGIGGLASAYLWVADATKTHPTNPELPLAMVVIFALAAVRQ